jgi:hypothetical protein
MKLAVCRFKSDSDTFKQHLLTSLLVALDIPTSRKNAMVAALDLLSSAFRWKDGCG